MTIEERMVRNEMEDQLEIGRILEQFYNSDAGAIVRALVNSQVSMEAAWKRSDVDGIKPSRRLGRIEASQKLLDSIELAIHKYHELTKPQEEVSEQ